MLEELGQEMETMHRLAPLAALASKGAWAAPTHTGVQPSGGRQANDEASDRSQEAGGLGVGLAVAPAVGCQIATNERPLISTVQKREAWRKLSLLKKPGSTVGNKQEGIT